MKIITTKDDLRGYIEDLFDSHPPDDDILDRITEELWDDGHEMGLRSGQDWSPLFDEGLDLCAAVERHESQREYPQE